MAALELVALLLAEGVCWVEPAKPFSVLEEDWIQTASFGNSHPRPHRGTTNRGRIHVQNHLLPKRSIICATRRSAPLAGSYSYRQKHLPPLTSDGADDLGKAKGSQALKITTRNVLLLPTPFGY